MDVSKQKNLEKDLSDFESLFDGQDYKDVLRDVKGAYLGEKPVSSIDLSNIKLDIKHFLKCMDNYFFVKVYDCSKSSKKFTGIIYVSRFRTLVEAALGSIKGGDFHWEEVEYRERADLDGLLHGYSPQEIYDYCVEQELTHLIK